MKLTDEQRQKLNVPLLQNIKKHILEEPRRFQMARWCDVGIKDSDSPPCGTAACIGGWAVILSGVPSNKLMEMDYDEIAAKAGTLIGLPHSMPARASEDDWLDDEVLTSVFLSSHWPYEVKVKYDNAFEHHELAEAGAARIDWLIEKGE